MVDEPPGQPGMATCPRCKRSGPADSLCTCCGAEVKQRVISCPECQRPLKQGRQCMFCGTQSEPANLNPELYEVSCETCGRSCAMTKENMCRSLAKKPVCQYCGGPLQFPEIAQTFLEESTTGKPQRAPFRFQCPGCERTQNNTADLDHPHLCKGCGFRFLAPQQPGDSARMAPVASSAAPPDVRGLREPLADLPDDWRLVGEALVARLGIGELAADEVRPLVTSLKALNDWSQPGKTPFLPLPPNIVVEVLPHALGAEGHFTEKTSPSAPHLVLIVEQKRIKQASAEASSLRYFLPGVVKAARVSRVYKNLALKDMAVDEMQQRKLRLAMTSVSAGTKLLPWMQLSLARPTLMSAEQTEGLAQQLWELRPKLLGYFFLVGLYGQWAAGRPAFRVTEGAIKQRLKGLGLDSAPPGFAALIVRTIRKNDRQALVALCRKESAAASRR